MITTTLLQSALTKTASLRAGLPAPPALRKGSERVMGKKDTAVIPAGTLYAAGSNGQISVDGDFITMHRKGFSARLQVGKGEKRLPISTIAGVQWKPAGGLVEGFIQFSVPGGNERRSSLGSATKNARQDENSVTFNKKQQPAFEEVRTFIETSLARRGQPTAQAPAPIDLADQLGKLAALRDQGILNEAEFAAQKAKLLG